MLLNGLWDFGSSPEENARPVFDSVSVVPGCADAGRGEHRKRLRGFFRRFVEWQGGPARLTVDGVALRGRVLWDGKEIGATELPFAREEYLFDSGAPGRHELVIITDNFAYDRLSDQHLSLADFYVHTGIFGDVTLEAAPPEGISHIAVTPLDHRTGEVEIRLEYFQTPPAALTLSFDEGPEEKIAFTPCFRRKVPDFRLWTPEHPALHTLRVNGVSATFGIRTLDWSGERLLLNGEAVKLIGANRHESHPTFGAATPPALQAADLFQMKKAGFNFIRGSHYPQRQTFLDLCDRIGMLVWEEAIGSGATEEQLKTPEFVTRQQEQCRKMVRKSINHPSVIIWGFLNETATDRPCARPVMQTLMREIRAQDSSRPITFASCKWQTDLCLDLPDIVSLNVYPGWKNDETSRSENDLDQVAPYLTALEPRFPGKPVIISEIGAAGMYGDHSGLRWSEDYQAGIAERAVQKIRESPRYTGIALWQFCDTGSFIQGKFVEYRPRGFNNKGLVDEFRRPKLAWLFLKRLLTQKDR